MNALWIATASGFLLQSISSSCVFPMKMISLSQSAHPPGNSVLGHQQAYSTSRSRLYLLGVYFLSTKDLGSDGCPGLARESFSLSPGMASFSAQLGVPSALQGRCSPASRRVVHGVGADVKL